MKWLDENRKRKCTGDNKASRVGWMETKRRKTLKGCDANWAKVIVDIGDKKETRAIDPLSPQLTEPE